MRSERSRLLILLVLVSVVATAGWSTALAREHSTAAPGVGLGWASVSKPIAAPTSGEPDVGQTPHPNTTKNGSALYPEPGGRGASWGDRAEPWFRWIVRTWTMRCLGAR